MKKWILLLTCVLSALLMFGGCAGGEGTSSGVSSEAARKSTHTKSQAEASAPTAASGAEEGSGQDAESAEGNSAASGGAYEANGFKLISSELIGAPEGLGGSPTETDIVFLINNVTDGSVTMSTERTDLLIYSAEYEVDSAVSGTLKVVVTDEEGTVYTRENETEFAQSGANSFQALIKTSGKLGGAYTLEWYIDGLLAGEAAYTK